ncbi:MAG: methyltransferase domain-containing protein, partial [Prochlorothrix sp.]
VASSVASSVASGFDPIPGPVLEVGCGTGFLSEKLVQCFPQSEVVLSDLAEPMLAFCRSQLAPLLADRSVPVQFHVMDGEHLDKPDRPYGLIMSSFALQWFQNPTQALQNWLNLTVPGGWIAVAFPSVYSFPEWRSACEMSGVPYTANLLPAFQAVVGAIAPLVRDCHFASTWHTSEHPHPRHFFQHLKAMGTGYRPAAASLTPTQWKHLWRTWENQVGEKQPIMVSYHVVYLIVRR